MTLNHSPAVNLVLLIILLSAGFRIRFLVLAYYLVTVALYSAERRILRLGKIASTSYVMYLRKLFALGKFSVKLYNSQLAHAVHKKLCTAVNKYRRHDFISPIVIMRKTAQTCLKSADSYFFMWEQS